MPISSTPTRDSSGRRRSETGTPTWLLKLPTVLPTGNSTASMWAMASLAVVLPALPVTPTMRPPQCARPGGQVLQGGEGIRYHEGVGAWNCVFYYRCGGALLHRQRDVGVAIVIGPAQREEKIARRQRAGVHGPAGAKRVLEDPRRPGGLPHYAGHGAQCQDHFGSRW